MATEHGEEVSNPLSNDALTWRNIRERDFYLPVPEPDYIGPSWERDENGEFALPRYSLGWGAAVWAQNNLLVDGEPLRLTPEQARLLLHWYEVDEFGRFVYRQGTIQRLKGW